MIDVLFGFVPCLIGCSLVLFSQLLLLATYVSNGISIVVSTKWIRLLVHRYLEASER